jgi:hypothetical protein
VTVSGLEGGRRVADTEAEEVKRGVACAISRSSAFSKMRPDYLV